MFTVCKSAGILTLSFVMTKTFYDLGVKLSQAVVQTLQELHFQTPTPVQV